MNLQNKLKYLKELRYILITSKKCGQTYNLNQIKMFMELNLLPPMPLFAEEKMKKIKYNKKINKRR